MVGHAPLGEIISADLLRAVSGSDLAPSEISLLIMPLLHLQVIELGAKKRPGFGFILQL